MRVPVMHGIVALLTEANAVPWCVCHLRVMLDWVNVMNVLSFPEPPIPSALLALVLIPAEYRLSESFPSFRIVNHKQLKWSPPRFWRAPYKIMRATIFRSCHFTYYHTKAGTFREVNYFFQEYSSAISSKYSKANRWSFRVESSSACSN